MLFTIIFLILLSKIECAPLNRKTDVQIIGEVFFKNEKYNIIKVVTHSIGDQFKDSVLHTKLKLPTKELYIDKNRMATLNRHTDLQKVGEIFFKNEKYNVIKVVKHFTRDHFKDFVLRTKVEFPTKKLYIDKNGMRHYWKDLENKENYIQVIKETNELKDLQIYEIHDKTDVLKQVGFADLLAHTNAASVKLSSFKLLTTTPPLLGFYSPTDENEEDIAKYAREQPAITTRKPGNYIQATFYCPFLGNVRYLVPEPSSDVGVKSLANTTTTLAKEKQTAKLTTTKNKATTKAKPTNTKNKATTKAKPTNTKKNETKPAPANNKASTKGKPTKTKKNVTKPKKEKPATANNKKQTTKNAKKKSKTSSKKQKPK